MGVSVLACGAADGLLSGFDCGVEGATVLLLVFGEEPVGEDFSFCEEGFSSVEVHREHVEVGAFALSPVAEDCGEFVARFAECGEVVSLDFVV